MHRETLDFPGLREVQVLQAPLDQEVNLDLLVLQVLVVHQEHREQMASLAQMDSRGQEETLVL